MAKKHKGRNESAQKKTKKEKEREKQAQGGDSKHHPRPQSRGGANTMVYQGKEYRNLLVLPGDVGRGNLAIQHPPIHKYFSNKTILECAVRLALIELADGSLNGELFKATQVRKRLKALETIAGEEMPRPRKVLEQLVDWYGRDLVRADALDQLGGRRVDALLERFMAYDDFLMQQTSTVAGAEPARIRKSFEIDSQAWSVLWSGDSLAEVVDFRLPLLEQKDFSLNEKLITRVGLGSGNKQPMLDAYKEVVRSTNVSPAQFAEIVIAAKGRRSASAWRERFLADRSLEQMLERAGDNMRFLLRKK